MAVKLSYEKKTYPDIPDNKSSKMLKRKITPLSTCKSQLTEKDDMLF